MSTLHHGALYETCFDECFDEFMNSNKLTGDQMAELCRISPATLDNVEQMAWSKFQGLCQ